MQTLAQVLTELVKEAAQAAGYGDTPVPLEPCVPTQNAAHGDYQSNFAFRVGKRLRTNPRQVATEMVAALPASDLVASAEVAGPGFINFRVTEHALGAFLGEQMADPAGGVPQVGAGKTVVIDYSSPNIAKRMHVGHLRSTVIGNALHRIYAALGWNVVADNHIGDWGTQFGKLIVAWERWRDEAAYAADPIGELQRIYQKFGVEKDEDPPLMDIARAETAKLQAGDPENTAMWKQFVDVSMVEFNAMYERLGVDFTVVYGESHYQPMLADLIEELLGNGTAVIDDGAAIIPFEPNDGKGLAKNPLLIRKSDGAALYGTTDLATARFRKSEWDPAKVIYVTDNRQQLHFRQVFAASKKIGVDTPLSHVYFGILKLAGGMIASTRAGGAINLVDLLNKAAEHAYKVVSEKSPELPEAERRAIAEAVGTGAVKYTDLSQNPQSDITFDWEKMLSLEGNTAPYLMYAVARCHSVMRKAGDSTYGPIEPVAPEERELALNLARIPEVIQASASSARPNLLCDQLFTTAASFGRFWRNCKVLADDVPAEVRASRLSLVKAASMGLSLGLRALGITPLQRM